MSNRNPSRRSYGTGRLYIKSGAYYGRWWIDGRRVNRKLGKVRERGSREGLTKREAEAAMRRQIELVTAARTDERLSVAGAGDRLVELLELKGRKASTIEAVRSALGVHLVPQFGDRTLDRIDVRAVIEKGWARENPVKRAAKPEGEGSPEIRFLTLKEVEAVLLAVPDDVLGSMEATLYLTAAMTALRQGELLGLRWSDVSPARCGSAAPTSAGSTGRPSRAEGSGRCRWQIASVPSWRPCPVARRSLSTTNWSSAIPRPGRRSTAPRSASDSRPRSSGRASAMSDSTT